jgi:hypothetical protein
MRGFAIFDLRFAIWSRTAGARTFLSAASLECFFLYTRVRLLTGVRNRISQI